MTYKSVFSDTKTPHSAMKVSMLAAVTWQVRGGLLWIKNSNNKQNKVLCWDLNFFSEKLDFQHISGSDR